MKDILQEKIQNQVRELMAQRLDGQKILNKLKEYLHLIVLNYLYSNKNYNQCVMYGGSALRICHGLPRLSVDLDFQIAFPINPNQFCKNTSDFFKHTYGAKIDINKRESTERDTDVYWLTLAGLEKLKIPSIPYTKLKIRLDFNKFATDAFTTTLVPISYDHNRFFIRTYPLSTLMATKVAALLERIQYSVTDGEKSIVANYKGRDIYDVIWYIQNGVIPNIKYLAKRNHKFTDYPILFKEIKKRLSSLNDNGKALRADLLHLYMNPVDLDDWMQNWEENFLGGLQNYSFYHVTNIQRVKILQNFDTEHFIFRYYLDSKETDEIYIQIEMAEYYIVDTNLNIHGHERTDMRCDIKVAKGHKMAAQYAGLFYTKIVDYLKRIHHIFPKRILKTRFIQVRYEGYDAKTTIVFTNHELVQCEFEDLL